MRFEQVVTVAAPRSVVWALLMDVPRVAACVPGAEAVTPVDGDRYHGALRVQVGPVRLRFEGEIAIIERDETTGRAALRLDAADRGAGSGVAARVDLVVRDVDGASELGIVTDAQILGRLGDFGQPIIKRKADQLAAEFARNLERAAVAAA